MMFRSSLTLPLTELPRRDFHMSKGARQRYEVDASLFSLHGDVVFADYGAAQGLAHKINQQRDVAHYPEAAIKAGDLYAAGLLHEVLHLLIASYREHASDFAALLSYLERSIGEEALARTLLEFAKTFPALPVYRDEISAAAYLAGNTAGEAHQNIVLEELLLLYLSNENPALHRMLELFDDAELEATTAYPQVVQHLESFFDDAPGFGAGNTSLFDLLRAPIRHSPTSLEGQLSYVRKHWSPLLGEHVDMLLTRILRSLDIVKEEQKQGFVGGPPETFVLDQDMLTGATYSRTPVEYERFSPDSSWMPRVVMLAKSSFVWLDQLSKQYGYDISRLDAIPDEELDELARRGFTGLWLIGLWERSEASRRIKHLRGQEDAVASAYALYDYVIAQDLGGDAAYENLRDRAGQRGIRLASDMVPNHVGIDGKWVLEHPDWFLSLDHSPYPGYSFDGPELSHDERIGIFIEDHYYDSSDAAVVFKRLDHLTGEARYIYHGNDGTSMPWNDTAQLDYSSAEVREAIIQTILHVARKFPIIRFDAAMTLAKQHIQRLWFPEPGHGGAIPSRAEYGSMSAEEFDRLIPEEFWRDVVDRVAEEVPDTLLLAEAFWMMEGYFVRTLGMHRVYNSAFMHMLMREENAKYRQSIKNILEFEPEILKRFVNFMSNPDEETAEAQFGKDDKYFGVCVLMCTLPGLPMFGHGQVEGYTEKYGMEYRRAKRDEQPDSWLVDRHYREIFPLMHRRAQFAEVENFLLYDFVNADGQVNEDVYAYSNRDGNEVSLVVFNNKFQEVRGSIKTAAPTKDAANMQLADGLALRAGEDDFIVLKEQVSGLEYLHSSRELKEEGFYVELGTFGYGVFLDIRELRDTAQSHLAQLHEELAGRGVRSVEEALADLPWRPVHDALLDALSAKELQKSLGYFEKALEAAEALGFAVDEEVMSRLETLLESLETFPPEKLLTKTVRGKLEPNLTLSAEDKALFKAWALLQVLQAYRQEWRLDSVVKRFLNDAGRDDLIHLLLRYQNWHIAEASAVNEDGSDQVVTLLTNFMADDEALHFLKVNTHEGVHWFNREAYGGLVSVLTKLAVLQIMSQGGSAKDKKARFKAVAEQVDMLNAAEERSGYQLDKLLLVRELEAKDSSSTKNTKSKVKKSTSTSKTKAAKAKSSQAKAVKKNAHDAKAATDDKNSKKPTQGRKKNKASDK